MLRRLTRYHLPLLLSLGINWNAGAQDIDEKAVVKYAVQKQWRTFPLKDTRLVPGSPFYTAMQVNQQFMLGADVERMLNPERKRAGLPVLNEQYPGSNQPASTRPLYLDHYLSGISLMYAQTGDHRFLERADYIIKVMQQCADKAAERKKAGDKTAEDRIENAYKEIISGKIELNGGDEFKYPWGGLSGLGNFYYGLHKKFASFRDAYVYCDNKAALALWIQTAEPTVRFVLKVNPDLFDNMLDVEHGGMNEVFADMFALTGDQRYMDVSMKFNHQKVILNIANGKDVLFGRHANMQVPTFAGTARQYQLTRDDVSRRATENFLDLVFKHHLSPIGGNSRYERFGKPDQPMSMLGYTSNETCNTYNMLKVALQYFQTTGDKQYMDYFERALYNHILASQDVESGGVTYYTSLMSGGFKVFSNVYDLDGVWCCVGTGMENHSKYGEAIFFHNEKDLMLNLFIPAQLQWKEKGLAVTVATSFPETDTITLSIDENNSFNGRLLIRHPRWETTGTTIRVNGIKTTVAVNTAGYIVLNRTWKKGDCISLVLPQKITIETAKDDPAMASFYHGPVLLAGALGKDKMPGSDLVQHALFAYREWVPPTNDIPVIIADRSALSQWLRPVANKPLEYTITTVTKLANQPAAISLMPYYKLRHQRQNVCWKCFTPAQWQQRKSVISDEINTGDAMDEKAHALTGEQTDTTRYKDNSNFWESNRIARFATNGGWFGYSMRVNASNARNFLVVTYWGAEPANAEFDVMINNQVLASENISNRLPLSFYETTYEIPVALVQGQQFVQVSFKAKPGMNAGKVYALKITGNPAIFPGYLFY